MMSLRDTLKKVLQELGPGKPPYHEISPAEYERCVVDSLKDKLTKSDTKKQIGGFAITYEGVQYETDLLTLVRSGNIQSLRRIGRTLEGEMLEKPEFALVPDEQSSLGNVSIAHVEITMPGGEVAEIRNVLYPVDVAEQRPSTPFSVLGLSDQLHTGFDGPGAFIDPLNPIYGPASDLNS